MNIKSPRFQLIIFGLIGYFLITIGRYIAFLVWIIGLFMISRLSRRESIRALLIAGMVINLIIAVIVIFGLGNTHSHESFWEEWKHGVMEQLLLGGIVAVILLVVYGLNDGWLPDRAK